MSSMFRKTALDEISSPDQLDRVIVITPPLFWLAMLGAALILLAAIIWSVFARIPVKVNSDGIFMTEGGIHVVYCAEKSIVDEVLVTDADNVNKGDVIAVLTVIDSTDSQDGQPEKTELKSDADGYVSGLNIAPGNILNVGDPVCRIMKDSTFDPDTDPLSAIMYLPVSRGKNIIPGMEVKIYPDTVNTREYGHVSAVVDRVDDYVTGPLEMQNILGDSSLVESFSSTGPVIQIQCSLKPDSSTACGYEWSNRNGAKVELTPGTTFNADIVVEKKAPITMFIPLLADRLNSVPGQKEPVLQ